jgi:aryl-alcohol dehydrogenase-like predicted oxidoreductase
MHIDLSPRALAGTDLLVGRVVFGTMTFGSQVDEMEAASMVERCREFGVTMFDTSNNYNGGRSEEILGQFVKPFRDEIQISTKVGSPVGQDDPNLAGLSGPAIHHALDDSLRRLGTDYIDLYYLHRPDWDTPLDETLAALDEVVRSGKVRYVAQSNYAAWQITEFNCLAERHDWPKMLVSQPQYNLLSRRIETEYADCSRHLGLSNIVYNPLAGGLLTGKHKPDAVPTDGSRFTKDMYRQRYWNQSMFEAVDELGQVARDAGMTLIELSFRWLLSRPLVDCMLLGASSTQQLEANLAALNGPELDEDTIRRCDDVWARLHGPAPNYNR